MIKSYVNMSVSVLSPPRTGISISSFSMAITHLTILLLLLWFCTNVELKKKKKKRPRFGHTKQELDPTGSRPSELVSLK